MPVNGEHRDSLNHHPLWLTTSQANVELAELKRALNRQSKRHDELSAQLERALTQVHLFATKHITNLRRLAGWTVCSS